MPCAARSSAGTSRYDDAEAQRFYDAVPTWGPHPDVPEGLAKVAKEIPLVILSNASND